MGDFDGHKIEDEKLRDFVANGGPDERISVIVEVNGQPAAAESRVQATWLESPSKYDMATDAATTEAMDAVAGDLSQLNLAGQAVRLETAQAFVLDVTPDQLSEVSRWELVGTIRPNRTHYASRSVASSELADTDEGSARNAHRVGPESLR